MSSAVPWPPLITALSVLDARFPTSEHLDGSDAMNSDPMRIADAHYLAPTLPGPSAQVHPESLKACTYPDGPAWVARV
ncbi:hypothetical protein [Streptomyces sp. B1-3]|uniref:hypothetical protein n=1 Tax=Streptomyces sp. B1-3 TaxID=3141453 RepID=UPI003D2D06A1